MGVGTALGADPGAAAARLKVARVAVGTDAPGDYADKRRMPAAPNAVTTPGQKRRLPVARDAHTPPSEKETLVKPGFKPMLPASPAAVDDTAPKTPPKKTRIHLRFGLHEALVAWYDGARCEDIRDSIRRRFGLEEGAEWAIVDDESDEMVICPTLPSGTYTIKDLSPAAMAAAAAASAAADATETAAAAAIAQGQANAAAAAAAAAAVEVVSAPLPPAVAAVSAVPFQ